MPTKLAGATRRLQAAQRNFVKVHKEHARITLKKAKRASGSSVAGRTRRRKAGGGKRVMGWDVSPGWKKNTNYALKAEVMADNARNEGRRRWAAVKTAAKGGRVRRRR